MVFKTCYLFPFRHIAKHVRDLPWFMLHLLSSWHNWMSHIKYVSQFQGSILKGNVSQPPGRVPVPGLLIFLQLWNLPELLRILVQNLFLTLKDAVILLKFKKCFYIFKETRVKLQNKGTKTQKKLLPGLEL